ncbi:hypothetical protein JTE90_004365 [Oedothorax gibbosus]|uniref:Uncharacterized protein n=1 Tax=Oedothorax gibbosus TaxID=931172 RepID=A0AAV6VM14_9ARAC|nr:hypothetical protein JTE90_004365 [Oedothorax gibbosus]
MESKNHRQRPQASASMRPSISNSDHLVASSDLAIRHLTAPGLNGVLQDHNSINFKLIKTGRSLANVFGLTLSGRSLALDCHSGGAGHVMRLWHPT